MPWWLEGIFFVAILVQLARIHSVLEELLSVVDKIPATSGEGSVS